MSLNEQIANNLKQAMLQGDSSTVSVLRMLKSEIKNAEIAKGEELSDSEIEKVICKEVKKRQDSIESFTAAGYLDRSASEKIEADLLNKYLPEQASYEEVENFIKEYIQSLATENKNRGEIIRATLSHFDGLTDGKTVSELVAKYLN